MGIRLHLRPAYKLDNSCATSQDHVPCDYREMLIHLSSHGNSCLVSASDIREALSYLECMGKGIEVSVHCVEDGQFRICSSYDHFGVEQRPSELCQPHRE